MCTPCKSFVYQGIPAGSLIYGYWDAVAAGIQLAAPNLTVTIWDGCSDVQGHCDWLQ